MHPLALRCSRSSAKLHVSSKGVSNYGKYSPKTLAFPVLKSMLF